MWDRGLLMTDGPEFGLRLEFEPADVLIASISGGTNYFFSHGWGSERTLTEGRNGTDGDQHVLGDALHFTLDVGLKNPEIKAGILQPILGLGVGAFYLRDYDTGENDQVHVSPANGGGTQPVAFTNSWVAHGTIFLRLDFDIATHVKFGIDLRNYIIVYATKEFPGNMEPDKFRLDNLHYAFEPTVYFSVAF